MGLNVSGVSGSPLNMGSSIWVDLYLAGQKFVTDTVVVSSLSTEAKVGLDFLPRYSAIINLAKKYLHFLDHPRDLELQKASTEVTRQELAPGVRVMEKICMPQYSKMEVMAVMEEAVGNDP